jgi:hypothetical protein
MTKQDFIHIYDQSVYQIRLQTAINLYVKLNRQPEEAIKAADAFVSALQSENIEWLKDLYE